MTDIREQIVDILYENLEGGGFMGGVEGIGITADKLFVFMDEYALKVLTHARLSYGFSDMYVSDLKGYLEEIKTDLIGETFESALLKSSDNLKTLKFIPPNEKDKWDKEMLDASKSPL